MEFIKIHGLGNDFILVDMDKTGVKELPPETVRHLCTRKWGVGADGILLVGRQGDQYRMLIYNPDGTKAEMCGNGLRCAVKYINDINKLEPSTWIEVMTDAGLLGGKVTTMKGSSATVEVCIGKPEIVKPSLEIGGLDFTMVDVGNPHIVHFVSEQTDPLDMALNQGPELEPHGGGINVGFARLEDDGNIFLAVWERGAGFTGACGTGATAAATAARNRGLISNHITVKQKGGTLALRFEPDGTAYLTGPAETVYHGELYNV